VPMPAGFDSQAGTPKRSEFAEKKLNMLPPLEVAQRAQWIAQRMVGWGMKQDRGAKKRRIETKFNS
jgi:hypothetical protein